MRKPFLALTLLCTVGAGSSAAVALADTPTAPLASSPTVSTRVAGNGLERDSRQIAASVSGAALVTAGVRFHSGPGLARPVIGLVAAGTHVRVLSSTAGWTRVRLPNSQMGYILGIYVR
jgi:Bacterial SH3 domain